MTDAPADLRRWRLPRGRHGLPRELVVRSQRERLLAAVVRVSAAQGFDETTIADVLDEAGVGRETFYELFADKRACALTAHKLLTDDLEATVREAYAGPGEWPERVRRGLAAALDWFAADPAAGRFVLVELTRMGTESRSRFRAEFSRFVGLVEEGLDSADPDLSRASVLAVGAVLAQVHEEVVLGRTAELPALLPDLTYELLVPFGGEAIARAERERAVSEQLRPLP
jgi:AcrR family transcriptional regulator